MRELISGTKLAMALSVGFVLVPSPVEAVLFNLGTAGPDYWSVLEIGTGKIDLSNPTGFVKGNIGVHAGGKVQSSGPDILDNLYLGIGSTANFSGSANVVGSIFQDLISENFLNQARSDALAAAAAARLLPGSSIADITGNSTLGAGVYYLSKIDLGNGETLTLNGSASDSFVFNISDDFKLNSADILLTGGLTEANVLFNYFGAHDVSFSGGGNASELHGILLSLGRKVNLSPGLVVGEIISDQDISIVSGAQVHGLERVSDSSSTMLLGLVGVVSLLTYGRFVSRD